MKLKLHSKPQKQKEETVEYPSQIKTASDFKQLIKWCYSQPPMEFQFPATSQKMKDELYKLYVK